MIRNSGTVPGFAWYLVVVCTGMIALAIILKPGPAEDEFAHVADSDLESFLAPAAGGNGEGARPEEEPKKKFSLRETMRRRLDASRDR